MFLIKKLNQTYFQSGFFSKVRHAKRRRLHGWHVKRPPGLVIDVISHSDALLVVKGTSLVARARAGPFIHDVWEVTGPSEKGTGESMEDTVDEELVSPEVVARLSCKP